MPYVSDRQRAYIHAKADEGEAWAQKFTTEADAMPQPAAFHAKTDHHKLVGHLLAARGQR